ncbi:MAG: serine hydrolase domain-containing protein [Chthoniobacterales bacterium]
MALDWPDPKTDERKFARISVFITAEVAIRCHVQFVSEVKLQRRIPNWVVKGFLALCLLVMGNSLFAHLSIETAADYSREKNEFALIVARDGRIIYERYGKGTSASTPQRIYSGTKGFWCVLAMAAQQDNILRLDNLVGKSLPDWRKGEKAKVSIRELLNFTSGLPPTNALHGMVRGDRDQYARHLQLQGAPGSLFQYGPASLQVFDAVLDRQLEKLGLSSVQYLNSRLLLPLGIPLRGYSPDIRGHPLLAASFTLTAREWLRFGNFLARSGIGGPLPIFPIVSSTELSECFQGSTANPMFGMGFWLNRHAKSTGATEVSIESNLCMIRWPREACISRNAPAELIAAVGSYGQRLYIVPSEKLVIVRLGNAMNFSDAEFLKRLYSRK